jgi:hypothetical protein
MSSSVESIKYAQTLEEYQERLKTLNPMETPEYASDAEIARSILKTIKTPEKAVSDGSTASYYELPTNCSELQDLISAKNMNAQIGEIFRECYRYGQASHSDELRGIKKILFYANAELKRLENVDS